MKFNNAKELQNAINEIDQLKRLEFRKGLQDLKLKKKKTTSKIIKSIKTKQKNYERIDK